MDVIVFVYYKGLPQPKVTPNSSSLLLYEIFQRAINISLINEGSPEKKGKAEQPFWYSSKFPCHVNFKLK